MTAVYWSVAAVLATTILLFKQL
ncbi:membrane protein [Mycobacterium phage Skinny]|uniref:Uncharacterized protein n=1 Tax=Mycobacterium phage PegLeg TaxID=1325953 RepID=R4T931_9CAUD|nr:hypothetical protein PEGLEG_146 [Mycobacterium phage PegLeg]UXE05350.1 membrane protein [Mycobacterium phage Skinny]WNN95726.1 hypothetical protein SEA_GLASKE16_145 [Mycobacterium phage Glaske16]WNN96298.1 hypothetical protein SEA_DULCITA_143 [Mycobacterium phage Dulcita]WNO28245.1 hypothetical protein SEA_DIMINIMUS_143 [Mycobacterium phage Diminimus]AGM12374.1 hypothetical protein PEGLEG_146 [Mycobacterium phage PegLeg]